MATLTGIKKWSVVLLQAAVILFGSIALLAQPPLEVIRKSDIQIRLEKKQMRELKVNLLQGDDLEIRVSTKKRVNFRITNGDGLVMHENVAFIKPAEWTKVVNVAGVFTLMVENVDRLLPTDVRVEIQLRRPRFTFGSGVPGSAAGLTALTERSESILTEGRVQLAGASARKYPYVFEKGDTLEVRIKGLMGPVPYVEISNEQKELLFAALPERHNVKVTIPVLENGKHELLLYSKPLTTVPFFSMYDSISVKRIAPARYALPPVVVVDSTSLPKPIIYDTIPDVMMDSVFYVGAVRDYIHPSQRTLEIPLGETENILFWAILYGVGREFEKEYEQLLTLISGEPLAIGATDPLAAFGMGYIKKLPGPGNPDVKFFPSGDILDFLDPPTRINYGIMRYADSAPYLSFENQSKSVGHNVYVKVVVFRRTVHNTD